ncbi:hypothetical protein IQ264_06305 [Phormidium sp. LEGE 05292]|uniref:hypothetical protein n=1 Tax=[Phormidium] sp. LEGE 05292 TaxID=767427 RepID=UPI001882428E|nr:hypothetical protein [Phormidium sp. LEGE 05292]MBE9225047.1 hypothetical protein [Phormidium sp. LEGE 05292]
MFQTAKSVIFKKVDIAEVAGLNGQLAIANTKLVVPQATILEVSARTGWQRETFRGCL